MQTNNERFTAKLHLDAMRKKLDLAPDYRPKLKELPDRGEEYWNEHWEAFLDTYHASKVVSLEQPKKEKPKKKRK